MGISKKALKKIESDLNVVADLMKVFQIGERGVRKMIERNDIRLTTPVAVSAISKSTGLKDSEILVLDKQPA